ncbi:MAG: DUF2200 domain-containing protein [Acholeplasmataceae bacterium]|nr:DUF2200 domain-containing protein [Acholeplasmataceae bacterium]
MNEKLYAMPFSKLYLLYIAKANKKGRSKQEVDELISWLTGYSLNDIDKAIKNEVTVADFFNQAIDFNELSIYITGKICGVVIDDIKDPLMKKIRYLDKLIDELAKGKALSVIKRNKI